MSKQNREQLLEDAVHEYLSSIEKGVQMDTEDFIQCYPEIQLELRNFVESYSALRGNNAETTEIAPISRVQLQQARGTGFIGSLDRFDITNEIATGGMSIVYRAIDSISKTTVAVKVPLPKNALNLRFIREIRAKLDHPNIVQVLEGFPNNSPPFLVMEFIDGETLEERIAKARLGQKMEIDEIRSIAVDLLHALDRVHQANFVHRDVKPGNIFLPENLGIAKLGDFGLVRSYGKGSSVTETGGIVGTAEYMSPEQSEGRKVDSRSDLFSLGSVIYAMCTGSSPFQRRSSIETILSIRNEHPKPLRDVSTEVPSWLSAIVGKLHQTHPNRRYQTASEVLRAFRENSQSSFGTLSFNAVNNPTISVNSHRSEVMPTNANLRSEITQIQSELKKAVEDMLREVGSKLKPQERTEIQNEFEQLQTILERLKDGKVWIALFGRTNVGKSALVNAILEDDLAPVGVEHDKTRQSVPYERDRWKIVDVPGVLGNEVLSEIAIKEAKQAHAHIFVVDSEPFEPELKLFNLVRESMPDTPCIIFVNRWDVVTASMPIQDRETIRSRISSKMGHLVRSPNDILYGNALKYDQVEGVMTRQRVPELIQRMYDDVGPFGDIINLIDPANQAANLTESIRQRVYDVRIRTARKVVAIFAGLCAASALAPYSQLLVDPALLGTMVMVIVRIMGRDTDRVRAKEIANALLYNCGLVLGAEVMGAIAAEVAIDTASLFLGPFGVLLGGVIGLGALGYWKFLRTAILGEVTLEYIRNDFSWGGKEPREVILACKSRAKMLYARLHSDPEGSK